MEEDGYSAVGIGEWVLMEIDIVYQVRQRYESFDPDHWITLCESENRDLIERSYNKVKDVPSDAPCEFQFIKVIEISHMDVIEQTNRGDANG